jgi:hypothetical protein
MKKTSKEKVSVEKSELIHLKYLSLLRYIKDLRLIISQNKKAFPYVPSEYHYRRKEALNNNNNNNTIKICTQ